MSSKKRKAARAWMHTIVQKHQEKVAAEARAAWLRGQTEERQRLTKMIPRDIDGCVYPGGKIEHPIVKVAAFDGFGPEALDYYGYVNDPRHQRAYRPVEAETLRAVQHALVLKDGTRVIWFGWELSR